MHFRNVVRALVVPVVVELVRIAAVWLISVWVAFAKGRSKRLEKQKHHILQELKVQPFLTTELVRVLRAVLPRALRIRVHALHCRIGLSCSYNGKNGAGLYEL